MNVLLVVLLGVVTLTACSSTEQATEYNDDTRAGFLASCADSVADSSLVVEVCACFYDGLEGTLEFEQLASIEESRQVATEQSLSEPLPGELEELIAACVLEEASLG